ncbi:MAG: 5'-nucleotidase C-terminal domain-containing protein [Armatimonadota bacterium]|nr:5'-nucleotidase C-terminal domain-containing protein [Armatimonadota bacterium]
MMSLLTGRRVPLLALSGSLLAAGFVFTGVPAAHADSAVVLSADFTARGSDARETGIGDLVADALRHSTATQAALVDAGSLQPVTVPRGPARSGQFLAALTVNSDPIVILTLSGSVLAAALERGASNLPQSSPGFLQVSGITFALHSSASPGARVSGIQVDGSALARNGRYTVAMPQSLAQGANGYFLVWPAGTPSRVAAQKEGEALSSYLAAHPSLSPSPQRIAGQ